LFYFDIVEYDLEHRFFQKIIHRSPSRRRSELHWVYGLFHFKLNFAKRKSGFCFSNLRVLRHKKIKHFSEWFTGK
jgi:hypothetical protein